MDLGTIWTQETELDLDKALSVLGHILKSKRVFSFNKLKGRLE